MTDRLTPTTPADRTALRAAYAAARARAAELGLDVYDDGIIRAAYQAARPLLLAEGRRQAAARIREVTMGMCMDGTGRHLVDTCAEIAETGEEAR